MRSFLLLMLLAGCATTPKPAPEPIVQTKQYAVATPVPCKAITELGDEPSYPDTDAALAKAPNIFVQSQLLIEGRALRVKRLSKYAAAKVACAF